MEKDGKYLIVRADEEYIPDFEINSLCGDFVSMTVNPKVLVDRESHLLTLADPLCQGPYKVWVQKPGEEFYAWPQSFGRRCDANRIIKRYLRPTFFRCVITFVREDAPVLGDFIC